MRKGWLAKWVANCMVVVAAGLPNLAITFTTITLLTYLFAWPPLLAYLAGQFFSVNYSVLWAVMTKSNFKVLGKRWHFHPEGG